jgi:DNA repair protein RecO (recombination protein O)
VSFQPKHTLAIVLHRTNYGESDRIVTLLSRDYGKVRVIAKGVRKEKAKLTAGVELFCVSNIGFVAGHGELATLVSARLVKNYHAFLGDLSKVEFGFSVLKKLNKMMADNADEQYYLLAEKLLEALNAPDIGLDLTMLWWQVNLAQLTGHGLNLRQTIDGQDFEDSKMYIFDQERGGFMASADGIFAPNHIKLLRMAREYMPKNLLKIKNAGDFAADLNRALPGFIDYHH